MGRRGKEGKEGEAIVGSEREERGLRRRNDFYFSEEQKKLARAFLK